MRAGLAGFTGGGKSTVFQLLTGAKPDPGKVFSGQVGTAVLRDPRLERLADWYKPRNRKITPASMELVDTPGLIQGSHGDNPQRLALIREADALVVILDGFSGANPVNDLAAFREELLFADLSVVTNRAERLEASVKKHRPDWEVQQKELELVQRVKAALEEGRAVAELNLSAEEKKPMRSFGLLTDKPQVIVLNGPTDAGVPESLRAMAPNTLALDAKLELELEEMAEEERTAFMEDLGITQLGRGRLIRAAYDAMGMISFFTAGDPEVRAWNLEAGSNAVEAAGKIHTDLAKGFIRAEVLAYDDLLACDSVKEAKAQNKTRLEGKDYIVKDGDIIYFRSNA
ncbi:GTP-binding protein YchF [Isosphaera pallida ATCC 43644]|uniref:GTP-binding protein YchF n=1 Tax=Isosphaera pallida (strain ATCC 43644 / DSM 9630 / IS1B) TaxID=575540 RepID=E8R3Q6_ISOPI|nr:DUF933 domain-containing protein [Isosphaera pallida]ADV62641.1 GTP-binding protein YchF [Isosphaera pallida ATCC 43644]